MGGAAFGSQGKNPLRLLTCDKVCKVLVLAYVGEFGIIQPSTAQAFFIHAEPQRFNQMQLAAGVGAQTDNIAGVGRYFRFEQNNIEHSDSWQNGGKEQLFLSEWAGCAITFGYNAVTEFKQMRWPCAGPGNSITGN